MPPPIFPVRHLPGTLLAVAIAMALPHATAQAQDLCGPGSVPGAATWWLATPLLLLPALMVLLYAIGVARLWRRAGPGKGIRRLEALGFALGTVALFAAIAWPLDGLAEWSLAAHMGQHMLLLAVVPPLLLAGRPMAGIAQALPARASQWVHRAASRLHKPLAGALWPASVAHGATMIVWHVPAVMAAALANPWLHMAMHLSFVLAGFWFWIAVWQRMREPVLGAGAGLLALVAMMMVMGFLGALLTFSSRGLYPIYTLRAALMGGDPMRDQQLAGLLMWVPSCLPYLVGGLWLLWAGLRRLEMRADASAG